MCGISGVLDLNQNPIPNLRRSLRVLNDLLAHRGPDGEGQWLHRNEHIGFAHRRLSIVDFEGGSQPMTDGSGNWIVFNGEVYNHRELALSFDDLRSRSDTEVILRGYRKWGLDIFRRLRGMFSIAIWDEAEQKLVCARDPFGIKPFYFTTIGEIFVFASEAKALLPFLSEIESDIDAIKDYLTFQIVLDGKTLFKGIKELAPGHILEIKGGTLRIHRYWQVYYEPDLDNTPEYFELRTRELIREAIGMNLRADVPIGACVSGGIDSSLVASTAHELSKNMVGFHGRFDEVGFDESRHARAVSDYAAFDLYEVAIQPSDFTQEIENVIYHLDFPVAGPGSFAQFMVSRLASTRRKAILGGQGGDEIFGGYVRYLVAYFEQCIKAAINGTAKSGDFVVTYESIIPNLVALRNYQPMLQEFWREGLFEDMDKRYFRLVNRANDLHEEVNWDALGDYSPYETFCTIFMGNNIKNESYFDRMTHFDFKTLLPALLHVEDRMSMAHGLESRVPLLDIDLVEFVATIPANVKFKNGTLKTLLKTVSRGTIPDSVIDRTDKMGFPVPLNDWLSKSQQNLGARAVREFVYDILSSEAARNRALFRNESLLRSLDEHGKYGRKLWGLLSLELWQRRFHDRATEFRSQLKRGG
jgi:asparagine synthase (glutamine-hydrolysing)